MTAPATRVLTLRLGQFRSYQAALVETDGANVALVGPNGAGKTNVLEAVSLLVPGRGLRRSDALAFARSPGPGGWRLRADVAVGSEHIEVVTGAAPGEARRTVEIGGKPASQAKLGEHVRIVWLTPAMDRLWSDGAGERRRFIDRIALGFDPAHGTVSVGYEKAMRDRNRLLKEGGADPAWLDALETQMARCGAAIACARARAVARLTQAQERAQTLFPRAELRIIGRMETRFAAALAEGSETDQLERHEAAGLVHALQEGRGRDMAAGRTLEGPHRSDLEAVYATKRMPAAACSTGEQKALLISLCLANARALGEATGRAPVLLFDEIAAHLDAERRQALYAEIAGIGAQAWMTGTEAHLFDGLGEAKRFVVREVGGVSEIGTG